MKRSTVRGRTYLELNKLNLPTQAPNDYSSGAFCLKLSPQWFGIVIGFIDHLFVRGLWDDKTDEQWQQLRLWIELVGSLIIDCEPEQPEPCPECPEPGPKQLPGGGGYSQVGQLGLTLEELESMVMGCLDISGSIKYDSTLKTLVVWSCHDGWVPIAGMVGTISVSGELGSAAQSVDEWIASGSPEITPVEGIIHQNELYVTMDSLKCAKATAIVEEFWNVITGFRQITGDWGDDFLAVAGMSTALAAAFPVLVPTFAIAAGIIGLLIKFLTPDLETRLQFVETNEIDKQTLICVLAEKMIAPVKIGPFLTNKMTAQDVQIALDTFEDIIPHHEDVRKVLGLFPIQSWISVVSKKVAETECGCDTYLPNDYQPPAESGQLQYTFKEFGWLTPFDGATIDSPFDYDQIKDSGQIGTLVGEKPSSISRGTNSPGGVLHHYHNLMAIYELSEPATLSEIKGTLYHSSGIPSTMEEALVLYAGTAWNSGTVTLGNANNPSGQTGTAFKFTPGAANVKYFAVALQSRDTAGQKPVTLESIRISGTFAGVAFTGLQPGEIFDPTP